MTRALLVLLALTTIASARPLPVASKRAAAKGPVFYVDAKTGDDAASGTAEKPWKTLGASIAKLKPGHTLYLRGGVYYEAVTIRAKGSASAPITIRSAPGELAIVDAGLRELAEAPKTAWEPVPGRKGELRTTKTYPSLGTKPRFVVGHVADTMVPLHPYKFDVDLRATNLYWNLPKGTEPGHGIYVGPGLWFDPATQRIHARLEPAGHAKEPPYTGPRDPRTAALVVGVDRSPLRIEKSAHVRVQDLVLRGSAEHTLHVEHSDHVEIDGLTIYGGAPAVYIRSTDHLRFIGSTVRGLAAPWSSRASMKYRGNSPYLFFVDSKLPQSRDWEIAYSEFTDSHDGIVIDSVKTLRFHHNRVDNFNDDALYLTLTPREAVPVDVHIYENHVSRTYTALAFGQREEVKGPVNTVGPGVHVFRNVFDLRVGTYNRIPVAEGENVKLLTGRMCGDHGGPLWEPLFFYNNTVLLETTPWRNYYGAMLVMGVGKGTQRRLYNNIFAQLDGSVGTSPHAPGPNLEVNGNLLWSRTARGAPNASTGPVDVFDDPKFVAFTDQTSTIDLRLGAGSPAIDAGVPLPSGWPDSLKSKDKGRPDLGAIPAGSGMPATGPSARATPSP